METKQTLSQLLAKPIWQMTGEEFLQLNELGRENAAAGEEPKEVIEYAHGITELSQKIGCCQSTIYMLKKEGVLDDAIVSQVGRKIIFNVGKARALADEYQRTQREIRRENL